DGKVSNVELVNAIVSGFDEIKAAADSMPLTVAASWTRLENRLLVFVGKSETASAAAGRIAGSIGFITDHLEQFVDVAIKAGEVALAMFAAGKLKALITYTEALFAARAATAETIAAAEAAAAATAAEAQANIALTQSNIAAADAQIADAQATQVAIQAARESVTAKLAAVNAQIALTQATIAATATAQEGTAAHYAHTEAVRKLALAEQHRAAVLSELATLGAQQARVSAEATAATAAQAAAAERLAVAQGAAAAGAATAAGSMSLFARAIVAVNWALGALVAAFVGWEIGKWARQFEWVQYVGANVAQMTAKFVAFADFMTRPLSLESWKAFRDELGRIDTHFDGVRARIGQADSVYAESAQKVTASEQAKTQAIEAAALMQKEAFKNIQEATKALTASIDAETKMQTASIEQGLTERLALIDAMNLSEAQKDTLRVTAKLEAYSLELQLQQQAGAAKLALIDQEYQTELAGAANNAARTAEIETQKRQDKLAVYTGLAEYYQGEVNRLSGVYASEMQAAALAKQQLANLNQSHEMALFNIKLMGMTEREKLDARESLFAEKMRAVKAERAKGDKADQEKINTLLGDARSLHGQITAAAGNGSEALSRAKSRENKLWEEEKTTLKKNAEQHEENARRAKEAQGEVASKLEETQSAITSITEALNKDYALKIGIDSASLSAAQSTIAALTAPATKTITIQTVNAGGGDVPSASAVDAPVAQSTGGSAGQPTGEPWRFNQGGWVHRLGLLPGYGGGDRRKVLAEDGEFIVRKEAVKQVGLPFMALVNAGKVPVGDVIRRALGGPVDPRDWQLVESRLLGIAQAAGRLSSQGVGNSQAIASGQARLNDDIVWKAMTTQVDDLIKRAKTPDIKDESIDILRMAASEFQRNGAKADMDGIKARIKQMIDKRAVKSPQVSTRPAALSMKTLNDALSATPFSNIQEKIQQRASTFSVPVPTLPAQAVAPSNQSASGNMMRVQFVSPDGSKSEGMFNSSDATTMLRVLKDAGARTV
ncbi:MAG: hypothetical protein ACXWT0_09785, partial [Methylobacter sp.]